MQENYCYMHKQKQMKLKPDLWVFMSSRQETDCAYSTAHEAHMQRNYL